MAPAQSKRQSRKRRKPGQRATGQGVGQNAARPRAQAAGVRSEGPAQHPVLGGSDDRRSPSTLGAYGERPGSLFGGLPVSEMAIFIGGLSAAVGFFGHNNAALIVGLTVCALGVAEFTAREHFTGYRSHTTLLAAMPAVAILVVAVAAFGAPQQRTARILLLVAIVPVFALLYWGLRKRFRTARQARIVRRPGA